MYRKSHKRKKCLAIGLIVIIIILSFLSLSLMKQYEAPGLIGKWKSLDTGQVISFSMQGEVHNKSGEVIGSYHISSPSMMEYSVDGYSFNMIYRIEERKLYWGIAEDSLEEFIRK